MEKLKTISLNGRYVLMAFFLIFGVLFLFRLVYQPVIDWDEEVYLHLSRQMTWTLDRYTTQNSHIDRELSQAYYRSPVFHQPPLVPLGIKLLSFAGSLIGAKILNMILWGISVLLVYVIACKFTDLSGLHQGIQQRCYSGLDFHITFGFIPRRHSIDKSRCDR